ncbi:MAG: hypothetical protein DWQ47_00120 [Acidobacteria bacterium]|nr:MAG: hypothetical protein DWQ32_10580 [Acidobacteriota bacterium]REK03918.1 MAG: hypothetical protein DWQ38_00105 [Acidobacteriota bacterium]REK15080.1 MAG: hypothetical protein DWQ43_16270 [Acidobacteriota bacterium]REK46170.1 MAG: hypothetical protein DWQ47_00120 [Acidobacteriota bacterium]
MRRPLALLFLLALAFVSQTSAFQVENETPDPVELRTEVEKMVRETAALIPTLSSTSNRVNGYLKLADMSWEIDEELTWALLGGAAEDVKRFLAEIDIETNRAEAARVVSGNRGRSSGLRSKTNNAFSLRKQFVSTLAGYSPEQARAFVRETAEMFTNAKLIERALRDNRNLETTIEKKVAANDIEKAIELGTEKLKKGVSSDLTGILSNIYRKDKAKGQDFGELIVERLLSEPLDPGRLWIVTRFFQMGLSSVDQTVPMFDSSAMRSLTSVISTAVLDPRSKYTSLPSAVLTALDRYSAGASSRISSAFEERRAARENSRRNRGSAPEGTSAGSTDTARMTRNEARAAANQEREDLGRLYDAVSDGEASSDERKSAIAAAKDRILSVDDDRHRYTNLAALAVRAFKAGEPEEAQSLLREAEMYLRPTPKDRSDYRAAMTVAHAYSTVDPDRAFTIYEEMAYRLNGVIDGYVRFAEYSGNGRSVENGEMLMNRYARQFTGYFNFPETVVLGLAAEDVERLADLSDRFDRPEVRAHTRLSLIESLLKATEEN